MGALEGGASMHTGDREVLAARIFVLSTVLQEVLQALAPAQKAQIEANLKTRIEAYTREAAVTPEVDAAIAGELAALLRLGATGPR